MKNHLQRSKAGIKEEGQNAIATLGDNGPMAAHKLGKYFSSRRGPTLFIGLITASLRLTFKTQDSRRRQ
jgi:hypothetical protein